MRIEQLFNIVKGSLQSSKCVDGSYPFITASAEWKTHVTYSHDCEALIFAAAASGSLGRVHYVKGKFISSDLCFILTPKDMDNYPIDMRCYQFIFNFIKNDIVQSTKSGTSKEAIGLNVFGKFEIPYLDFNQQKNISNKYSQVLALSSNISTELNHQLELVKKLRQSLLQDAVQGKLLPPQTTKGGKVEHAADLLQQIKAEKEKLIAEKKIKKEKPLPPIKPEEIPFEIPSNWVWCRLGEITLHSQAGKSFKASELPANLGQLGVIKTSAITTGIFLENENKSLPNNVDDYSTIKISKGDLIFCRASGSKGLAGKSCIVTNLINSNLILSDKSIRYLFPSNINKTFVHIVNISTYGESYYHRLGTKKSTSMNNITREQFDMLPIPLPPYSFQNATVNNLDKLLKYCDNIETSIKASQQLNQQLTQQVLSELLQP